MSLKDCMMLVLDFSRINPALFYLLSRYNLFLCKIIV